MRVSLSVVFLYVRFSELTYTVWFSISRGFVTLDVSASFSNSHAFLQSWTKVAKTNEYRAFFANGSGKEYLISLFPRSMLFAIHPTLF